MDRRIIWMLAATGRIGGCSSDGGDAVPAISSAPTSSSSSPRPSSSGPAGLDPCRLLSDANAADLLDGETAPPVAGDELDQLSALDLEAGGFAECTWQAIEPGTGGDPDRNFTLALNIARGEEAVALFEPAASGVDYAEYNLAPVGDMVLVGGDTTFFGAIVRVGDSVIQCDVTNF
ncbi:MAG: hypothetical protein ACR2HP_17640 [Ilumatobacteraceae bacterium]